LAKRLNHNGIRFKNAIAAGFTLYATSTNPANPPGDVAGPWHAAVHGDGGGGLLPALHTLFDKAIAKTTQKADFFWPYKKGGAGGAHDE
jgi:hypothetical protein